MSPFTAFPSKFYGGLVRVSLCIDRKHIAAALDKSKQIKSFFFTAASVGQIQKIPFAPLSLHSWASQSRSVCISSETDKLVKTSCTMSSKTASIVDQDLKVQHNADGQEFVIILGQDKALLQYTHTDDGAVDLWHTEVPPVFRGKGVAKLLAQAAMDHFAEKSTPMRLSCTYLQKYVQDYPQTAHQKYILK